MSISPELRAALNEVGKQIADEMKATLQRNNNNNTDKLKGSINVYINSEGNDFVLDMEPYGWYVNNGAERHSGRKPPIAPIQAWIKKQGIIARGGITPKQLPYVIQASIAKRGQQDRKAYPFIGPSIEKILNSDLSDEILPVVESLFEKYKPQ